MNDEAVNRTAPATQGLLNTCLLIISSADSSKPTRRRTASTSYDAEKAPSQINLTTGEVVEEVSLDHNGWTVVRNNQGEEGAVPTKLLGKFRKRNR